VHTTRRGLAVFAAGCFTLSWGCFSYAAPRLGIEARLAELADQAEAPLWYGMAATLTGLVAAHLIQTWRNHRGHPRPAEHQGTARSTQESRPSGVGDLWWWKSALRPALPKPVPLLGDDVSQPIRPTQLAQNGKLSAPHLLGESAMSTAIVTLELRATGTGPRGHAVEIWVDFYYLPTDPYAINLVISEAGHGRERLDGGTPWLVSREVLDTAVNRDTPAGMGDFTATPWAANRTRLSLSGLDQDSDEDRVFHIILPTRALARFLRRTFAMVPAGQEPASMDLDGALDRLFGVQADHNHPTGD
jgi:hypothetical protein